MHLVVVVHPFILLPIQFWRHASYLRIEERELEAGGRNLDMSLDTNWLCAWPVRGSRANRTQAPPRGWQALCGGLYVPGHRKRGARPSIENGGRYGFCTRRRAIALKAELVVKYP